MQRILVALDLTHQSGREQLSGFYRYADAKSDWEIRLVPSTEASYRPMIEDLIRQGIDGVVMKGECVTDLSNPIKDAGVPIVAIDRARRGQDEFAHVSICNDNRLIGRDAILHFDSLGRYAAYGFAPDPNDCEWSRVRGQVFCREATSRHPGVPVSVADASLSDWLVALPKPAAVFVAFDAHAATVLETCRELNLKVPGDIAVLGVDNDALICEHTRPKLSSIRPDHEGQGFAAARTLDRLLSGYDSESLTVVCPPLGVIERDTTENVPPAVLLVRAINTYLDQHALEPVSVAEIIRNVHVSARLANLRYAQAMGHSIREELIRRRLKEVQHLLLKTDYPIKRIAARCGFKSPVVLTHLFHKRTGMSLRDWREANRSTGV